MNDLQKINNIEEAAMPGNIVNIEEGARRSTNLINKGEIFDGVYTHPKVLAAVYHVLKREFKLNSLNGRDANTGEGNQALHADYPFAREENEPFYVVNSLWLLDDYTETNDATRIIPRSHLVTGVIGHNPVPNPRDPHPDQLVLTASAGSVVVLNSHTWHGGTINTTSGHRRVLYCFYTSRARTTNHSKR